MAIPMKVSWRTLSASREMRQSFAFTLPFAQPSSRQRRDPGSSGPARGPCLQPSLLSRGTHVACYAWPPANWARWSIAGAMLRAER